MSNLRVRLLQAVDAELADVPRGRMSDGGDERREFLEAVCEDLDQGLMTMAVMGIAHEYVRRGKHDRVPRTTSSAATPKRRPTRLRR